MSNKDKNPLISIVTACYNSAEYAYDMLKSVAQQNYANWELIVVDDCSTDNSVATIKKRIKNLGIENKAKVLVQARNRGYGYTLWNAINHSSGQLIAVLDIDDALYGTEALSIPAKLHCKYSDIALTYSNYMECDEKLDPQSVYITRQLKDDEEYISTKIRINHLKVFKRIYYDVTEGVNYKLRQTVDKDLVLKLEEVGKLRHINQTLYAYRKHNKNISRTIEQQSPKYQDMVFRNRLKIYEDARSRRQARCATWLKPEKCVALQKKWGDYDAFIKKPNIGNKKEIIKVIKKTVKQYGGKPSILDVGCGAGHFMWAIKDWASELHGMDYAPTMLALTQTQFLDSGITPVLKRGSCWDLPYGNNSVDIVFQVDVCMHVGDSWKSIKEMLRVARRFVVFTGPSFESDLTADIDMKFENGKRWKISIPLLTAEMEKLKAGGEIKHWEMKHRDPTKTYKHKILVIEK